MVLHFSNVETIGCRSKVGWPEMVPIAPNLPLSVIRSMNNGLGKVGWLEMLESSSFYYVITWNKGKQIIYMR